MSLAILLPLLAVAIMIAVSYLKGFGLPKEHVTKVVSALAVVATAVVAVIYKTDFLTILATLTAVLSSSLLYEILKKFGIDIG